MRGVLSALLCAGFACACHESAAGMAMESLSLKEKGGLSIMKEGRGVLDIQLCAYRKGWGACAQSSADVSSSENKLPDGAFLLKGSIAVEAQSGGKMNYIEELRLKDGVLSVKYEIEATEDLALEMSPFISLRLPAELYKDKSAQIGDKAFKLPADNQWAWGRQIILPSQEIAIELSEDASMSVWDLRKWKTESCEIRIPFKTQEPKLLRKGERAALSFKMLFEKRTLSKVAASKDWTAAKLDAYARILACPAETGLSLEKPKGWLKEKNFALVEGWLSARSVLYDISDRVRHLKAVGAFRSVPSLPALEDGVKKSLALLNEGRTAECQESLAKAAADLESAGAEIKSAHGLRYYPGTEFNPYGWLKNFTITGFKSHPEGAFVLEPSPFNVSWEGGPSISLLKERPGEFAIEKALTTEKKEYEGVLFKGRSSLSFERTWVGTEWLDGDGATYTFTVLSPIFMVENVTSLYLGGLPPPRKLAYKDKDGKLAEIDMTAGGSYEFPAGEPRRNWMLLKGDAYTLQLIMGRRPIKLSVDAKGSEISYGGRTFVGIVKDTLPGASPEEAEGRADLLSRMALALPVQTLESRSGDAVKYNYLYKENADEWGTAPLKVAPVPPLASLGGLKVEGAERLKGATKYGDLLYVPGAEVSFKIPAPAEKLQRGINASPEELVRDIDKLSSSGIDWVRLFIGKRASPEEGYAIFEKALEAADGKGVKILVDPHDFIFAIDGKTRTVPTDEKARAEFVELWRRLSAISQKHKDCIAGYDLYNELPLREKDWKCWLTLAAEAVKAIREGGDKTPVYLTCVDYANPCGFNNAAPAQFDAVYSFHLYVPHGFTHQKVVEKTPSAPFSFYPGWVPPVDWSDSTYGKGPMDWWDRWELGAAMLPPLEFMARNKVRMHCGEFSPVGYTKPAAALSAGIWTRDAADWLERSGISWHLWNGGFGLCIPEVAAEMDTRWKRRD